MSIIKANDIEAVTTPKIEPTKGEGFSGAKYQRAYYQSTLNEIHANRKYSSIYWVNSVPKSGSTYTMAVIRKATDSSLEYGGDLELEVEQTFSLSGFKRITGQTGNILLKSHSLPNFPNVTPIRALEIRYINIYRNLSGYLTL